MTALNLLRCTNATGTIISNAMVLSSLKLHADALAKLAPAFERAVIQCLGYVKNREERRTCKCKNPSV